MAQPPERLVPERMIYGRRHGPRLRPAQKRRLEAVLPAVRFELPEEAVRFDPRDAFHRREVGDVWLEIGFGGGEHLAAQARAHPEIGMIGVEPYEGGIVKLLAAIEEERLDNVRILVDDARRLLRRLPEASIGHVFILFPDPWPKKRHHKRRIVNPVTVADLARAMRPGAELRLATDDPGYVRAMLATVRAHPGFRWLARRPADWRERPADSPPTRYEEKARAAGRHPVFLRFARTA